MNRNTKPDVSDFVAKIKETIGTSTPIYSGEHAHLKPAHSYVPKLNLKRDNEFSCDEPKNQERNVRLVVLLGMLQGNVTQGAGLRKLRKSVFKMNQEEYAKLTGVSRKTISDVENDRGNYSVDTMNRIFKPLGFKMGVVPMVPDVWKELF